MADETLAVGARLVGFRQVLRLGASKSFSPIVARGQAVSVIDGMSALVPQELLAPLGRSAFDLQHLAQLEGLQAGMSEIKRNCDGRDASRREPLVPQVAGRSKYEAALGELFIKLIYAAL